MTEQQLRELLNVQDGILYRVTKNKSEIEMLQDADQSIYTFVCSEGYFIKVYTEFSHPDYEKVQ
jgi:hypothetical protein